MQRQPRRDATAFTLVELLVVIAIITILAAILVPTIGKTSLTAKIKATLGLIRSIQTACALYHTEIGNYPGAGAAVETDEMTAYLYKGLTLDRDGDGELEPTHMQLADGTARDAYMTARAKDIEWFTDTYKFVDSWGSELGYDELEVRALLLSRQDANANGINDWIDYKPEISVQSHLGVSANDPRKYDEGDDESTMEGYPWKTDKLNLWSIGPDGMANQNAGIGEGANDDNIITWSE